MKIVGARRKISTPPGAAVARRQDGGPGTRGRRAEADVRRDVRGAQALRQRRASVKSTQVHGLAKVSPLPLMFGGTFVGLAQQCLLSGGEGDIVRLQVCCGATLISLKLFRASAV